MSVGAGAPPVAGVGVGEATITFGMSGSPPPPRTPTANKIPTKAPTTTNEASSHFQMEAIPINATSKNQRICCSPNSAGPCSGYFVHRR